MIRDYFQMPVNSTWISTGYSSRHTALDMGWTSEVGRYQPIYPIAEGVVVDKGWYNDGGNYIWTKHETSGNTWYAGYMHMKNSSPLSIGTKVTRKTQLGNMGSTGKSTGPHVHFVLVKAPKGTEWSNRGTVKYRVNPANYLYRFPHQVVKGGAATIKAKPKTPYSDDPGKITDELVQDVIAGKYGNGDDRRKNLEKAGYVYKDVQEAVNAKLRGEEVPKDKDISKVVDDVIAGKYGNGDARRKNVEKAGYNYSEVQKAVNEKLEGKESKPKPKPEPAPKPKNDVGKKWTPNNVPLTLYPKSSGGTSYSPSRTKRTYTILAEENGRIQIKNKYFSSPGNKVWVKKSDGKVAGGSKPKPASNIGKYANMRGNVRLFKVSRKDDTYPRGSNRKTNVRARSAKILEDDNGRVLVSVPSFDPNKVWLAKSEVTITDKPKYPVN